MKPKFDLRFDFKDYATHTHKMLEIYTIYKPGLLIHIKWFDDKKLLNKYLVITEQSLEKTF